MFTHNFTRSWSGGGNSVTATVGVEGRAEGNIDDEFPAGEAREIPFACDFAKLKSLFIISTAAVSLKAGVAIFELEAGKPLAWMRADGALRDASGQEVTGKIEALTATAEAEGKIQIRSLT